MTVAVAGCEWALSAGTAEQEVAEPLTISPVAIDAGIVFSDRENYLCLPFDHLGLAADDVVSSVSSSCECVQHSVNSYRSTAGRDANAILLRFLKDDKNARSTQQEAPSNASITPIALGVLIDLKLTHGSVRQFLVKLLVTTLAKDVAS
jgi:hypothetical protein